MNKEIVKHTLRCLLGCNIGEVAGMIIGFQLGFDFVSTIILAVGLAFMTGYAFTVIPMLRTMPVRKAVKVAIVGDTASITAMEFTENSVAFLIPGFVAASLFDAIFWVGLLIMFPAGFLAAYPVMSWAMKREMKEK